MAALQPARAVAAPLLLLLACALPLGVLSSRVCDGSLCKDANGGIDCWSANMANGKYQKCSLSGAHVPLPSLPHGNATVEERSWHYTCCTDIPIGEELCSTAVPTGPAGASYALINRPRKNPSSGSQRQPGPWSYADAVLACGDMGMALASTPPEVLRWQKEAFAEPVLVRDDVQTVTGTHDTAVDGVRVRGGYPATQTMPDTVAVLCATLVHAPSNGEAPATRLAWEVDLQADVVSTPTLSHDGTHVYVGSNGNNVYALDVCTGKKNTVWPAPRFLHGKVKSNPVLGKTTGLLYVGTDNHRVHAINTSDTSADEKDWTAWEFNDANAENCNFRGMALTLDEQILYAGATNGNLYAITAKAVGKGNAGKLQWNKDLDSGEVLAVPVVSSDSAFVYVACEGVASKPNVFGFDRIGNQQWAFRTNGVTGATTPRLSPDDSVLYLVSDVVRIGATLLRAITVPINLRPRCVVAAADLETIVLRCSHVVDDAYSVSRTSRTTQTRTSTPSTHPPACCSGARASANTRRPWERPSDAVGCPACIAPRPDAVHYIRCMKVCTRSSASLLHPRF